jgi:hypothetical protein
MRTFRNAFIVCLLSALACAAGLRAQQKSSEQATGQTQEQPDAPIPAYHSPLASQSGSQDDQTANDSQKIVPDNRSLAGAQELSLGSPETSRSYWQPHVDVTGTADSNALGGNTGWTTYTTILGGIDLHKISGHSDLTVGYVGGESISNDGSIGDSVIQQLNFAEKVSSGRLTLSFLDHLDYLPQASLGSGYGGSGLALPGGGSLGLQAGLTPIDSVLTTRGQRVDNSFLTQADVNLTPRSSVTVVGGYTLLDYLDNSLNLLNYTTATGQAGYNRQVSRKNKVAVFYRFNAIRYSNVNQSINDNVVQVSYGRAVTGRLAFQAAAGPEYTTFSIPILTNTAGTTTSSSQLNWSANTSLTYQLRRMSLAGTYFHGVSAGSGVFSGSVSDTVTVSLSKQLSRTLSGGINGGYAKNRALAIPGFAIFNQSYNYSFGGVTLSRPFGRSMNLYLSYTAQYQTSNVGFCAGVTCGTSVVLHLISAGFHWQTRPMLF